MAYAIGHSPLVKTAFFASDPNLGRILAAVGYAGIDDLDQSLIDPAEIETPQLSLDEVEKAQGPVGLAAHPGRLKPRTVTGEIDIEPRMENLAQGISNGWVFDTAEM